MGFPNPNPDQCHSRDKIGSFGPFLPLYLLGIADAYFLHKPRMRFC
jgi:hypothetical protein